MVMKICLVCCNEFEAKTKRSIYCSMKCKAAKRYERDKDKIKARVARWAKANPEKVYASAARWAKANPEKIKAGQVRWRKNNSEKVISYSVKWQKNNPEKYTKLKCKIYLNSYHLIENPPEELVAAIVEMQKIKRELKEQQP